MEPILLQFIDSAKRVIFSFWLSIFKPKAFFFSDKYSESKSSGKLYLYVNLTLYLIYFSTIREYFEFSYFLKNAQQFTTGVNIVELIFLTLPLLLYCVFLTWLPTLSFTKDHKSTVQYFALVAFGNILFWESGLAFIQAFLLKMTDILNETLGLKITGGYIIAFSYLSKLGLFLLPIYFLIQVFIKWNVKKHFSIIILLPITLFASNIVYSFYYYEFLLLKDPKAIVKEEHPEFIDMTNLNSTFWNVTYGMATMDSAELFVDFYLKNNTEEFYIKDANLEFYFTQKTIEVYKTDSSFSETKQFLEKYPFNRMFVDGKLEEKSVIIKPKSLTKIRAFVRFPYDLRHAIWLQKISSPNYRTSYKFTLLRHNNQIGKKFRDSKIVEVQILNFTEDRVSLNKFQSAVQIYLAADSVLGYKRVSKKERRLL
jgi:hypothetical protein